jgi:hypothetical protein
MPTLKYSVGYIATDVDECLGEGRWAMADDTGQLNILSAHRGR